MQEKFYFDTIKKAYFTLLATSIFIAGGLMKLNIWMIANRLSAYSTQLSLKETIAAELNSALPVAAPGSLYISAVNDDVICECEQGRIQISDISFKDAFLLIQSIFNWYQDWFIRVGQAISTHDFSRLASECQQAFGNPVMLQDANYCLLGMCWSDMIENMPPEWKYNYEHGQSSSEGYRCLSRSLQNAEGIYRNNIRIFGKTPSTGCRGMYAPITYHDFNFAKIIVLEYSRTINCGDICLMEQLTQTLSLHMAAEEFASRKFLNQEILSALLEHGDVPIEQLSHLENIIKATYPGSFLLLAIDYRDHVLSGDRRAFQLIKNIAQKQFETNFCSIVNGILTILLHSPQPMILVENLIHAIDDYGFYKDIKIGVSLEFQDLKESGYFFQQAVTAIQKSEKIGVSMFYDIAPDFLMQSSGIARLCACEPTLRKMWNQEPSIQAYLDTLRIYLDEERSAKAAAEKMFIHKNTLVYRIKYLKEHTNWDLDSAALRNYLRLSFYILENTKL